jgi:hypothetical protein
VQAHRTTIRTVVNQNRINSILTIKTIPRHSGGGWFCLEHVSKPTTTCIRRALRALFRLPAEASACASTHADRSAQAGRRCRRESGQKRLILSRGIPISLPRPHTSFEDARSAVRSTFFKTGVGARLHRFCLSSSLALVWRLALPKPPA